MWTFSFVIKQLFKKWWLHCIIKTFHRLVNESSVYWLFKLCYSTFISIFQFNFYVFLKNVYTWQEIQNKQSGLQSLSLFLSQSSFLVEATSVVGLLCFFSGLFSINKQIDSVSLSQKKAICILLSQSIYYGDDSYHCIVALIW